MCLPAFTCLVCCPQDLVYLPGHPNPPFCCSCYSQLLPTVHALLLFVCKHCPILQPLPRPCSPNFYPFYYDPILFFLLFCCAPLHYLPCAIIAAFIVGPLTTSYSLFIKFLCIPSLNLDYSCIPTALYIYPIYPCVPSFAFLTWFFLLYCIAYLGVHLPTITT